MPLSTCSLEEAAHLWRLTVLQSCCKAADAACIAFLEPEEPLLEAGQTEHSMTKHIIFTPVMLWTKFLKSHERWGCSSSRLRQNTNHLEHPQTCHTNKNYKRKKKSQNHEPIAVLLLLQESILVTIIHVPEWKTEYFQSHKKWFSLSRDNQITVL